MSRTLDEILDSPAPAGVRLIAGSFLHEWLGTLPRLHEHGAGDEEALHDYRVALRKLRSWLKAFDEGGGKAQQQLSDLNEATGSARDYEVMVAWLKDDTSPAADHAREKLKVGGVDLGWVEARTQRVGERLEGKLGRYSLEVPLGGGAAVVPFSWAYAAALRRLHHELTDAALRVGSLEDPDRLHKVRIRAKRLRYAVVPLKEWPEAADAIRLLKERQDVLGELHDRHAFALQLEGLLGELPSSQELQQGLSALLAKARDEGRALFQKYSEHRHANDVRIAALIDVVSERLGKRLGLHVEVVPQG